jgi:hypothetical protein
MSSRVGTAIPASRSTAWSSVAVGLTRSIQTAFSGSAARSGAATFFNEDSAGTNTENMENSGTGQVTHPTDLARFWQALHDKDTAGLLPRAAPLWPPDGRDVAPIRQLQNAA